MIAIYFFNFTVVNINALDLLLLEQFTVNLLAIDKPWPLRWSFEHLVGKANNRFQSQDRFITQRHAPLNISIQALCNNRIYFQHSSAILFERGMRTIPKQSAVLWVIPRSLFLQLNNPVPIPPDAPMKAFGRAFNTGIFTHPITDLI